MFFVAFSLSLGLKLHWRGFCHPHRAISDSLAITTGFLFGLTTDEGNGPRGNTRP